MNQQHVLIRKFNQATLFVLGVLLFFSCVWTYLSNQALNQEASIERANYIAGAISDSVTHAMEVGVPLNAMRGVDILLRARANENESIHHIAILNLAGAVMWQAAGGVQEKKPVKVISNIHFRHQTVARVQVSVYPASLLPMMVNAVCLQLVLCMIAYAACYESVIFALGRGVVLREQAKKQMRQAILKGQLNAVIIGQNRSSSDSVLYGMAQYIRRLNEKIWRIRRLTASLMVTEPDAQMRAELEATLARAEGKVVFADRKPEIIALSSIAADTRWLYFIVSVAVESVLQVMVPATSEWMNPVFVLFAASGAMLGLMIGNKLASRYSSQLLLMLGVLIILLGLIVILAAPLTFYSVSARLLLSTGVMVIACGCYGVVTHTKEQHSSWPIATITGGLLVGRLFSLLALEWFDSDMVVMWAILLVLLVVFLTNRFSWGQSDIWRRPIGKIEDLQLSFSPVPLCNGMVAGLLFSFALAKFVFNEGYGNEMLVTLSWFLLGVGAWFGYQLPAKWRVYLWGLASAVTGLLIFEHEHTDALSLLFCFSLSALTWHIRHYHHQQRWLFDCAHLVGMMVGAGVYLVRIYYFPHLGTAQLFGGVVLLLGIVLLRGYMQTLKPVRS